MRYILSSYGVNNPYIVADIPDHAVYPIGIEGNDFIDLDYSLLLVGTGFFFDQAALDYLEAQSERTPFLKPMLSSIQRLKQEGFLETFDGRQIVEKHKNEIVQKTERLCEDVSGWIGPVRSQWNVLRETREEFLKKFGTKEKQAINAHHFAVANAVLKIDGSLNPTLLQEINRLIDSRRTFFSSKEADYVREVLRPLVSHIVIQDLLRYKTAGSVLDWEDSQPYYEKLYTSRWDQDPDRLLAYRASMMFSFSLPELRPKSVDAVVKFIRNNRNVLALRADVTEILGRGEKFDAELGRRIASELLKAELAVKKKMKGFRLLGAALGMIVPGGSLVTEAVVEGGTLVGEDAVEGAFDRPHRWFYSLSQG